MERCADVSEGECILLCKETPSNDGGHGSEGINKLIVMDDNLVWTATASSTIKRWRVPGQRTGRMGDLISPGFEADCESPTMTPIHGRAPLSPFGGFSQDAQPSALLTLKRDSFANLDTWYRSESPVSISDAPSRRAESPSMFSARSPKRTSHLPYKVAIPGPFASDASLHSPIPQGPTSLHGAGAESTLYGIPFQSLIKLASPSDTYSLGSPFLSRGRDPDVATLYSAASIRSVPGPLRHFSALRTPNEIPKAQNLHPALRQSLTAHESASAAAVLANASHHTARFTNGPPEEIEDAARVAYESREVAADAIPLNEKHDDIIEGTQGIVRSVVLNDRWHALTVDTRGQVGAWDIVWGQCLGVFEREDVEAMMHGSSTEGHEHDERKWSPREALEAVRERIEGEAVVSSWCTVDSSIGNLMVHVQYPQCFDGEIYADETGYGSERPFDEDARRKSYIQPLILNCLD
jgi:WD repeat-containing protein 48